MLTTEFQEISYWISKALPYHSACQTLESELNTESIRDILNLTFEALTKDKEVNEGIRDAYEIVCEHYEFYKNLPTSSEEKKEIFDKLDGCGKTEYNYVGAQIVSNIVKKVLNAPVKEKERVMEYSRPKAKEDPVEEKKAVFDEPFRFIPKRRDDDREM